MEKHIEGRIVKIEEISIDDWAAVRLTIDMKYPYTRKPVPPQKRDFYSEEKYEEAMKIYERQLEEYKEDMAKRERIKKLHLGDIKLIQDEQETVRKC